MKEAPNLPENQQRILAVIGPFQDNNLQLAALLKKHRPDLADSFRSVKISPRFIQGEIEKLLRLTRVNKLVIVCNVPEFPLLSLIDLSLRIGIDPKNIICILEGEDKMIKDHLSTLGIAHASIIDWENALADFQALVR